MKICIDSNILIYSVNEESEYYKKARKFIENKLINDGIAVTDITLIEFFQVTTNEKVVSNPFSAEEANGIIQDLLNDPRVELLQMEENILKYVFETSRYHKISKYEIYDHIIANICKFYDVDEFYTVNNHDFDSYDF